MEQAAPNRIEYIDAMRGLTMILVVYFHIAAYGFGSYEIGYNNIIERFRMPTFFFISGWLFYKIDRIWDKNSIIKIITKKFRFQIIPTVVFMVLYLIVFNMLDISSFGSDKKGYWFTYVLFEFFIIYIISEVLLNKHSSTKGEVRVMVFMLILSTTAFYYAKYYNRYAEELGGWKDFLGFLSFVKIRHIIFFWCGTFAKRHFDKFLYLTNQSYIIVALVVIFSILILYPTPQTIEIIEYPVYFLTGISGTILLFTFFRIQRMRLSLKSWYGRYLIHIGRRTLDIYLIHYFFLPYHIEDIGNMLHVYDTPYMALLASMPLTFLVIVISLFFSYVIRQNHFLEENLFGVKKNK